MKKIIALICSLFFLLGCGDIDNPGGVLTANQLPQSVIKFIKEENILENEEVIAYYDVTIALNNTESAILTDRNLIYYKSGRIDKMPLNSIESVSQQEDCFGVCIVVTSYSARVMKIDIAPWNGGELFLDLLLNQTN
tara:strand:+ start:95 stop:505 length:411 start_codon:yes stop_codon:yes gene_type:complete